MTSAAAAWLDGATKSRETATLASNVFFIGLP
jgi:hypothetical protein